MTFKLEGLGQERVAVHSGGSQWQLLCFDFTGATAGAPATGLTFIFDIEVPGNAESDPDNWTFYFDAIEQASGCTAPPPPPGGFPAITFDDPAVDYTLGDFGGAGSVITNDPAGGSNQVVQTLKPADAEPWAGTVVSTLAGDTVPQIPFTATDTRMTVRVYSPAAGIPVMLKVENALAGAIFAQTLATTTVANDWETLTFDFANPGPESPPLNLANTYNRLAIFFDFGTTGVARTYYFDDIEFGGEPGGGGAGIIPDVVLYATDPTVPIDLVFGVDYTGLEPFGSGSVFDNNNTSDPDYSPAFSVTTGFGYGAHIGQLAFVGFEAGFASSYGTLDFKVKGMSNNLIRVKFLEDGAYLDVNLTAGGVSTPLGNGWYQVSIPLASMTGIPTATALLFETDNLSPTQFTFLLTDIGFSGTAGGGGGGGECAPVDGELAANGDFETGDLSCWEAILNGGSIAAVDTENNTLDGQWSARVSAPPLSNPTLKLNFLAAGEVAIGDVVDISFDMKGAASAGGVIFPKLISEGASGSVGLELQTIASPTAGWTTYTYSPTITADVSRGITFEIAVVCGGVPECVADVYIDNVSVSIRGGGGPPPPADAVSIDFDGAGPFNFTNFGGGVATVLANPDPSGLNTSAQVARMQKFTDQVFGGATLPLNGAIDFSKGPAFTVLVWSSRPVPVLFKLEGLNQERSVTHSGGGQWQLLCFDFTGATAGAPANGITFIFDLGVMGNAQGDPDNWTFYFDAIEQVSSCGAPPPPPAGFPTITFDDPEVTYTLDDFGGNASVITNDPAGGSNQVVQTLKTGGAEVWAGTTVATLAGNTVPAIPFTVSETRMSVRVYSPAAGIPVMLKVENSADGGVFVETLATTTTSNEWETLNFDFANPGPNPQPLNLANTYDKVSIFFDFGTAGDNRTYYFDDIAFGGEPGGGGGVPIMPEVVVYATDPEVAVDLPPPGLDNFGSGATFDAAFAADPDYSPAFQVTSGEGYGVGVHVAFVAFTGYAPGFAADFGTLEFKVKVNAPGSLAAFEVKFFGGGDVSRVYDLTTFSGASALGNGWYQVQIPMNEFAANIGAQDGFLLGPLGNQGGQFTMLLTDIGFSGTAGGGGGGGGSCPPVGGELATNGDFEAGDLSCWEAITNGGSITAVNTENNTPGGSWSARISAPPTTNPTLKLNFLAEGEVAIGDVIDISFDMKGVASAGGVIFPKLISEGASGSVGPILQTIDSPSANWTTYTYSPPIVDDVTRGITFEIAVVCGGAPECVAAVFIDNVSVRIR